MAEELVCFSRITITYVIGRHSTIAKEGREEGRAFPSPPPPLPLGTRQRGSCSAERGVRVAVDVLGKAAHAQG